MVEPEVFRILVAGSTTWKNRESIREELCALPSECSVVYGDAPGADALAGEIATVLKLQTMPMVKNQEDYKRYGKLAWKGLNERMIATGVDLILAFHPEVDSSTGTKHLLDLAQESGIPYRVITT